MVKGKGEISKWRRLDSKRCSYGYRVKLGCTMVMNTKREKVEMDVTMLAIITGFLTFPAQNPPLWCIPKM